MRFVSKCPMKTRHKDTLYSWLQLSSKMAKGTGLVPLIFSPVINGSP